MGQSPFYITTAISYVNGVPHLGHAYEAILTDVMARFKRLDGYDVMFLTGTDEHGEKVMQTAADNDSTPRDFADKNAAEFQRMTKTLGISNDAFIRTTEERHYKSSQDLWQKLHDKGEIYLGKYEGWYSIREEAYFTEDELRTSEDGQKFTPNGTEVQWVEEPSYFFKLSSYTDKLLKFYEEHPEFIQPESRRNEVISFVKQGLNDLSVSRHKSRLEWGIPVPNDEDHVMYVWLDALTNYITALDYPDMDSEAFQKFWPANFHVIGKDITRFHAIFWPAFLMAADIPLPKTVFAHGFINVEGVKMSKSLGNVLSPDVLVDLYGLDPLRFLLLREISHGQDGNFSHEHAVQRINADLANGLGNLAQRTLSMIYKNCDGKLPDITTGLTADDEKLLDLAHSKVIEEVRECAEGFRFNRALEAIWRLVNEANTYIDIQAPWTLKKTDEARMAMVLGVLAEVIRCLGILVQPYTPDSAAKILDQIHAPEAERQFEHLSADYALKPGVEIDKPEGVFPRIEMQDDKAQAASV